MFTGIITHLGKVSKKTGQTLTISIDRNFLSKIKKGMSISVDGICLTIIRVTTKYFEVDFIPETENRTTIKYLQKSNLVNLELPATPSTFLSGHIVQGHIDAVSKLLNIEQEENSRILKFSTPKDLSKYIVEKGSIAINGISLTTINAGSSYFTVGIIPFTWENTMLQNLKIGSVVNIEVDILAKYLRNGKKK